MAHSLPGHPHLPGGPVKRCRQARYGAWSFVLVALIAPCLGGWRSPGVMLGVALPPKELPPSPNVASWLLWPFQAIDSSIGRVRRGR